MWFKNLYIYRFTKPFELSPEEISEQLTEFEFQPFRCSALRCSKRSSLTFETVKIPSSPATIAT